jgi:hypothetical protein
MLLRRPNRSETMLNRRQRRKIEQKAAKETKANERLGFRDGHPVGLRRLSLVAVNPQRDPNPAREFGKFTADPVSCGDPTIGAVARYLLLI